MSVHDDRASGLTSPALYGFEITPDDNQDLPRPTRALMVGSSGNVRVTLLSGDQLTLPSLLPGAQYALRIRRVHANDTTAAQIVGLA